MGEVLAVQREAKVAKGYGHYLSLFSGGLVAGTAGANDFEQGREFVRLAVIEL